MLYLLHLLLSGFAFMLGVFCILTAIFLYADEEGRIQSKLEDIWIRAEDSKHLATSRHTILVTQLAQLETRLLDKIFGTNLMAAKALGVSFCLSIAAISLASSLVAHYQKHVVSMRLLSLAGVSLLAAAINSTLSEENKIRTYLAAIVGGFAVLICAQTTSLGFLSASNLKTVMVALFSIGALVDIAFIFVTRRLIRWAGEMNSVAKVTCISAFNLLLATILIGPGLLITKQDVANGTSTASTCVAVVALSNLFDATLALLFVVLVLALLLHRLVWPLLTRTLYGVASIGVTGRRKLLVTSGLVLLSWAGTRLLTFLLKVLAKD
jgi:hypothetical protein